MPSGVGTKKQKQYLNSCGKTPQLGLASSSAGSTTARLAAIRLKVRQVAETESAHRDKSTNRHDLLSGSNARLTPQHTHQTQQARKLTSHCRRRTSIPLHRGTSTLQGVQAPQERTPAQVQEGTPPWAQEAPACKKARGHSHSDAAAYSGLCVWLVCRVFVMRPRRGLCVGCSCDAAHEYPGAGGAGSSGARGYRSRRVLRLGHRRLLQKCTKSLSDADQPYQRTLACVSGTHGAAPEVTLRQFVCRVLV